MKTKAGNSAITFRAAIRGAASAARRKAFRNNMPVAITKNGKVVFIYKDKREVKQEDAVH